MTTHSVRPHDDYINRLNAEVERRLSYLQHAERTGSSAAKIKGRATHSFRRWRCRITSENLERFWLGGAAHERRDECTVGGGRAGERKTSWAKASRGNRYGDCFDVPGIDRRCLPPVWGSRTWVVRDAIE